MKLRQNTPPTMQESLPPPESELLVQDLQTEILIYDPAGRVVHTLNETAAVIFRLWRAGKPLQEIISTMEREYKGRPESMRQETEAVLAELCRRGVSRAGVPGEQAPNPAPPKK
jgi:hypothetical protein